VKRVIVLIFILSFSLLKGEIKIEEKVLETESVSEYNRWVKKNKYPGLKPIYILAKHVKRGKVEGYYKAKRTLNPSSDNPYINECRIYYYDDNGSLIKEEAIKGYVSVRVSPYFDEVLIRKGDLPYYPQKIVNIVKDKEGNVKFTLNNVFLLRFTGADIYLEDVDAEAGSKFIRIFDKNGKVIGRLEGASFSYQSVPLSSSDKHYFLEGYSNRLRAGARFLFLYSSDGKVLWRKEFHPPRNGPVGLYPSISGDGKVVSVGHKDKVFVYDRGGNLLREYKMEQVFPAVTSLSYDGKLLAAAIRFKNGTKVMLYNNENGKIIWTKTIEEYPPDVINSPPISISPDGKYIALKLHPDKIYLFGESGKILKQIDLHGIVTHPFAAPGKRIEVVLGVPCSMEWNGDILILVIRKERKGFNIMIVKVEEQ